MLVYRDTRLSTAAEPVLSELGERLAIEPLDGAALPTAGMLEAALADADTDAASSDRARRLTDAIADAWVGAPGALARARELVTGMVVPSTLVFTRPEGFAFYALDPASFHALASAHACSVGPECAVIGVRSIGTTLSAMVRATLASRGVRCERRTVRPTGHPFDRTLRWSAEDRAFLARFGANATYLVVDEGPGLSGSTLLSVAEALANAGIRHERIRVFCSNALDPARLCTANAVTRWSRFASYPAPRLVVPRRALDLSGGLWRRESYDSEAPWPASWVEQERLKFRTLDGEQLLKFEGFPPYHEALFCRARALADAGWSPNVNTADPGFLAFEWLDGRPLRRDRDRSAMVRVLARYLAFRVEAFAAVATAPQALETMARVNVGESLGVELPPDFALEIRTPVHADGHLMPHEWVHARDRVWKTDAVDHGDDHLYPGPCDVAWDLAGAVVEWDLDSNERQTLLSEFARLVGDDASARLSPYIVAYASFRLGLSTLAERNAAECARWKRARQEYERHLRSALGRD